MSNRDQRPKGANPKSLNFDPMFKFGYHIILLILKAAFTLKKSAQETVTIMKDLEQKHQGIFDSSAIKKAARFQGVQQVFINDAFAHLMNRNTNTFERTSNKLYFILTGLYDDIIDQKLIDEKILNQLFEDPSLAKTNLFETKVLVDMHLNLTKRVKNNTDYRSTLANIHQAQRDSSKQINSQLNQEELLDITLRKGGYSLLMCRQYIDLTESKQIDNCWYQLGGVIQFTNDLFDIYKDLQEGIQTIPNSAKNISEIKTIYDQLVHNFMNTIHQLPFEKSKLDSLKIKLSPIPAFGYLAIHNLTKLQDQNKELPNLTAVPRKSLIIDMEKTANRIKLIQEAYQVYKAN
ncbi:MAG: hypothetical protein RL621_1846 [Bacteroidota bacterium]|jgi:hypothetical protein